MSSSREVAVVLTFSEPLAAEAVTSSFRRAVEAVMSYWQGVAAAETSLSSVVAEVLTSSTPLVAEGATRSTKRVVEAVMF